MDNINGQTASIDIQFNNEGLAKSGQEAEKIANKTASNIAKTINEKLGKLKIGIKKGDLKKLDELSTKLNKTAKSLGDKLQTSLAGTNNQLSAMNRQLTKLAGNLEKIKANSNININVRGNGSSVKSSRQPQQQNPQEPYAPDWVYPNYFRTHEGSIDGRYALPDYSKWEYNGGRRDWQFGAGGYGGYTSTTRRPNLNTIHALDWNGAIDAEWRYTDARELAGRYGPDNSGHNINDQDLLNTNYENTSYGDRKNLLQEEKKQQKKRKKAEDQFISSITKVATTLTGIYGISSLMNKVGNVINEGAKLSLLSQYTQEDAGRLQAYNEAIKRTTHEDSYGQFSHLRGRELMTSLESDPQMATILGISASDIAKDPDKYSVVDILEKVRNAKQLGGTAPMPDKLKQGLLMKLGINPETAMALTSTNFNQDLKHVESIGTFSQQNVNDMKELVNTWEDLNQQAKIFTVQFIQPITNALHTITDYLAKANKVQNEDKNMSLQQQADIAYLEDGDPFTPFSLNHVFDSKSDIKKWKDNWIKQHTKNPITPSVNNNAISNSSKHQPGLDEFKKLTLEMENSDHNPNARNGDARGMYQITPGFLKQYGGTNDISKLYDPKFNESVVDNFYDQNVTKAAKDLGMTVKEATSPEHINDLIFYMYSGLYHGRSELTKNGNPKLIAKGILPNFKGTVEADADRRAYYKTHKVAHTIDFANVPSNMDIETVKAAASEVCRNAVRTALDGEYTASVLGCTPSHY